jgi:hypothetical protein
MYGLFFLVVFFCFVLLHFRSPHSRLPYTTSYKMTFLSARSIITTIGVILILHSTYSCLHYRSLAIVADVSDTSSPPLDVVIEVILAFALCLVGQLMCGAFHEVKVSSQGGKRRVEIVAPAYRTRDFDLFTTRSRALADAFKVSTRSQ